MKERDSQPSVLCEKGYVTTHKRRKKKTFTKIKRKKTGKKTRVAKKTSEHYVLMPRLCSQTKRDESAKPHPATEKSYKSTRKEKI